MKNKENIKVTLEREVALILFDFISELINIDLDEMVCIDTGERSALSDLLGKIEPQIDEAFMKNYKALVDEAKKKVDYLGPSREWAVDYEHDLNDTKGVVKKKPEKNEPE